MGGEEGGPWISWHDMISGERVIIAFTFAANPTGHRLLSDLLRPSRVRAGVVRTATVPNPFAFARTLDATRTIPRQAPAVQAYLL